MKLPSTALWAKTLKLTPSSDGIPYSGLFIFTLVAVATKQRGGGRGEQGPVLMPKFKCSPSSCAGP